MNTNCDGCRIYIANDKRMITCWEYNKNKSYLCPCGFCIVKMMCNEGQCCDERKDWALPIMYGNLKRIDEMTKEGKMDEGMKTRIQNMALRTWDYIGGDCLRALEDDGVPAVMPKEHVIEVVCDASYMHYHGGDKEAYEAWNKLPTYKEKKAVVEPAFLSKSYGW